MRRLHRPVATAATSLLLLLLAAAAAHGAAAAATSAAAGSKKGWGLREALGGSCSSSSRHHHDVGKAARKEAAMPAAKTSSGSGSNARRKRSDQSPSPVPHALDIDVGSSRADNADHADDDADANDKVALIQKLVSLEGGGGGAKQGTTSSALAAKGVTLGYFGLWFALNVYYNIVNKHVLNALPLPLTVATVQLGVGSVYVLLSWLLGLRAAPQLNAEGRQALWPIAAYHGAGQLCTVLSLGAAAVSFTHIVKAMEPFFSALVAALAFRQIFRPQVYLSLVPVVLGVSVACAHDVSFSWPAFITAMASNLAFALRANYSKAAMASLKKAGSKTGAAAAAAGMTPANIYGVVTVMAFLLATPLALFWEGVDLQTTWRVATEKTDPQALALSVGLSGLFHYLNNEVMYLALDQVHPVTLAVGNTAKRVFIIVASLLVFRNPITTTGAVGSAVGIVGTFVYSLVKQHYDSLPPSSSSRGRK